MLHRTGHILPHTPHKKGIDPEAKLPSRDNRRWSSLEDPRVSIYVRGSVLEVAGVLPQGKKFNTDRAMLGVLPGDKLRIDKHFHRNADRGSRVPLAMRLVPFEVQRGEQRFKVGVAAGVIKDDRCDATAPCRNFLMRGKVAPLSLLQARSYSYQKPESFLSTESFYIEGQEYLSKADCGLMLLSASEYGEPVTQIRYEGEQPNRADPLIGAAYLTYAARSIFFDHSTQSFLKLDRCAADGTKYFEIFGVRIDNEVALGRAHNPIRGDALIGMIEAGTNADEEALPPMAVVYRDQGELWLSGFRPSCRLRPEDIASPIRLEKPVRPIPEGAHLRLTSADDPFSARPRKEVVLQILPSEERPFFSEVALRG